MSSAARKRVILVGVGGATCSGKTTLAKHLRRCLPNSIIIHQDVRRKLYREFDLETKLYDVKGLCAELIPIHPEYGVQDWDDPTGAIDWPRMRKFLREVKQTGMVPDWHKSHDHLNEQKNIPVNEATFSRWKDKFELLSKQFEERGDTVIWGLVDGFLLYWDEEVIDLLDARMFLRVSYNVLKQRRYERHGYHTAVQSDPEGALWRDPPNYFDQIVYPAYIRAHTRMFVDGDIEKGAPSDFVKGLLLIDSEKLGMDEIFEKSAELLWEVSKLE